MLIATSWLRSLINAADPSDASWAVTSEELDHGFVRVGFETEGYEKIPETTGPLVVGRVDSIEELTGFKKPIRHCFVDVGNANGTGEKQSIVCGARNFAEGDLVVVSLPGTVLPGNFEIAARETYGRMSAGMICSATELGLTDKKTSGIIVLDPGSFEPGDSGYEALGLDDVVFDVNVTPDRGYALSLRGLGREIAGAFDRPFVDPAVQPEIVGLSVDGVPAVTGDDVSVTVDEATQARRFGVRRVSGVSAGAVSPLWLQRELMLAGQRPVNAATDVTNYVMLALGQPMHAFDAQKITGGLSVRFAQPGEKLDTLDGATLILDEKDVVVADESGAISLAGVMGGASTQITDDTTEVVFEAATWDTLTTARTSRRHKLSSESSRRFERGVDPALVEIALDAAAALLARISGGHVEPTRTLVGAIPAPAVITMSVTRPGDIAGMPISAERVIEHLRAVGCDVSRNEDDTVTVTAPTWRHDLSAPEDLVEEVLRLEGLEDIPSITPTSPAGTGLTPRQLRRRAVGHALAYQGYIEILPSPFIDNTTFDTWGLAADDERRRAVTVQNPLEADAATIATTLLPSMLDALARNVSRGTNDVALYGVEQVSFARGDGLCPMLDVTHRPSDEDINHLLSCLPKQPLHVATVGCGAIIPASPGRDAQPYEWCDAVESAQIVARAAGIELTIVAGDAAPWHPGRCAQLQAVGVDGEAIVVGYAGELHPHVIERLNLPARTCAMELNLDALPASVDKPAPMLSAFPALRQDLALVVDENIPAHDIRRVIVEAAGELVESVTLFDVYRSEALGENRKSLAFNLCFRAPDRTLTDEECSAARTAAAQAAHTAFGATMRG